MLEFLIICSVKITLRPYRAILPCFLIGLDISDPGSPTVVFTRKVFEQGADMVAAGDYAYVAGGKAGGLQVIDLSNPVAPAEAGEETQGP